MDCKHPNIKSGYEAPYELAWCTHCGYITWCGDGLIPQGAEKSTDYTDWVRAHVRAWSCNAEAAGRGLCERWCGHYGCPAVLVGTTQVPDLTAKPVAWISNVQVGGGPEDPPEFDTVCVAGDQKPDDRNKWTPLYTAPPDLAARVKELEAALQDERYTVANLYERIAALEAELARAKEAVTELRAMEQNTAELHHKTHNDLVAVRAECDTACEELRNLVDRYEERVIERDAARAECERLKREVMILAGMSADAIDAARKEGT